MIRVENIDVWGFEHAVRAARNPMNSWNKSDSKWEYIGMDDVPNASAFIIGDNDLDLMRRLYKAGTEHRTYARMIHASMDVTAPLYFLKEADRYSVGKAQVSTSTMHKIHAKEFTLDDFSHENLGNDWSDEKALIEYNQEYDNTPLDVLEFTIDALNKCRKAFLETKDKKYWWDMIQLLPSSYNQLRTLDMSYEVVFKIIKERDGHKLDEWNQFVETLRGLPYIKEIMEE